MGTIAEVERLIDERANLVPQLRSIHEKAEGESRSLTAEEQQEFDRIDGSIDSLTERIKRAEKVHGLEPRMDVNLPSEPESGEQREISLESPEYRDALEAYARGQELSAEQRTTLNVGTDADGGFTVPEHWAELYESLREFGTVRQYAEVITTSMGGDLHVPRVSAAATLPAIEGEEDPIADDGETFDEVVIGAYKYARITKASEEFVQDSAVNVQAFVGRRLGEDLAIASGAHYLNGTGTGQPEGLFQGANLAFELAANGAITADEVIDLFYSVISPYRSNGVWVCNDSTVAAIRKLKDSQNQYLWQPSLSAGNPDTILGRPVVTDPNSTELGDAADSRVIGFGDVRRAYTIRDVLGVSIKFLDQTYAENDQVAWRGKLRTSGAVVDANAFKVADLPV